MVFVSPSIVTSPLVHWGDGAAPIVQSLDNVTPIQCHLISEYKLRELELHKVAWLDCIYPEPEEERNLYQGQFHHEEVLGGIAGDLESWLL